MTLVQLKHFISLARTGSFARSAAALHLTQPALSRSIRALEDELGQRLFDRIGRVSELTPFGRETLDRAQDLVLGADDLRASGARADSGQHGLLRVGLGSGPGALLMTPLMQRIARERPTLRLTVARASTDLLVQALRERSLDALVVDVRSVRPAPDLSTQLVLETRGSFMVRPGHPLLTGRARPTFNDLRRYPIASTPLSDEVARMLVERYGAAANPESCVTLRCDEIPSLVEVARHSDAVVLAIRAAAPDLEELDLAPRLEATARFGLVTLKRRTPPPALAMLRELVQDLFAEHGVAHAGRTRARRAATRPRQTR